MNTDMGGGEWMYSVHMNTEDGTPTATLPPYSAVLLQDPPTFSCSS